jgi:hypothetical protein
VCVYLVFLIGAGVFNLMCDYEERLETKFGNSGNQSIETFAAESNREVNETA